jgi:cyanate permease
MRTISQDLPGWYVVLYALAVVAAVALGIWLDRRANARADAQAMRRHVAKRLDPAGWQQ